MEPFMTLADFASRSRDGDLAHSALPNAPIQPVRPTITSRGSKLVSHMRTAVIHTQRTARRRRARGRLPAPIRARIMEWRE